MKKISIICIAAATLMALIVACVKELDVCSETELIGTVVEKSTMTPLSDVMVSVTDGDHIHSSTITGADGTFRLKVDFDKVEKDSYLYFSKSPYRKEEDLHGMGKEEYNYKYVALYDKTDPQFLPKVSTIAPYRRGTIVTTGGEVTSDGGWPVIARGVCYGTSSNPDLSSSHHHTTNGEGTGSFPSSLSVTSTGIYYIRAYATNENGTSYGKTFAVNDLPTFTCAGHTYKVAPAASTTMSWQNAMNYCNNLDLYGYTDWRLPTREEMGVMLNNAERIGGFEYGGSWWTSSEYNSSYAYCWLPYNYGGWYDDDRSKGNLYNVRPIRVDY